MQDKISLRKILGASIVALSLAGLTGCEEPGTAEKAGKEIDKAAEKAGDSMKKAGEKMKEATK